MKKGRIMMLMLLTLAVGIVTGIFIGRNMPQETVLLIENTNIHSDLPDVTKMDINTASAAQLSNLPGIGVTLASRIVEYRAQNGNFLSVEDLMQVDGIGLKKYDQIKHLIKTGG